MYSSGPPAPRLRDVLSTRLSSEHFDDGKLSAVRTTLALGPWTATCADAAAILQVRGAGGLARGAAPS